MALRYQAPAAAPAIPVPALLGQVLWITAVGLCITAAGSYLAQNWQFGIFNWVLFFVALGLLIGVQAIRNNEPLALVLYYAFTFVEGLFIGPTIGMYARAIGPDVVIQAALTTGLGMAVVGSAVYMFGIDLRRFTGWAVGLTLMLVLVGLVSIFFRFVHPTVFSWLVLAVFTLWTFIDFARIRAGGDGYNAVQLAVQLYLDALNIFLALLEIFGARRSSWSD